MPIRYREIIAEGRRRRPPHGSNRQVNGAAARSGCSRRITEKLADDMLEIGMNGDGATLDMLEDRGWPRDVAAHFGERAAALARRRAVRRLEA